MKERLKELLLSSDPIKERDLDDDWGDGELDEIVDHLLTNGVILPPCKPMDDAYYLITIDTETELGVAEIFEGKVCSVTQESKNMWIFCRYDNGLTYHHTADDIGESVFLTREEAEAALKERSGE